MSHAKNKVEWCLKKAEKELGKDSKHRGLIKIKPNKETARQHIKKAEHNLNAMLHFKKGFSDWCGSAAFYSVYHSLLAIITKFGYESRNQECTFALIYKLIEDDKIKIDKEIIEKISLLKPGEEHLTIVRIREQLQYGTNLSIEDNIFNEFFELAKKMLEEAKIIIEE
jgi:uncharacterized protein (UPF0332 family)